MKAAVDLFTQKENFRAQLREELDQINNIASLVTEALQREEILERREKVSISRENALNGVSVENKEVTHTCSSSHVQQPTIQEFEIDAHGAVDNIEHDVC